MDLGWCTIDLISEEDLGEDGSFSQFELARICPVDLRSCEIRREEIRRERDTLELVAKDMSKRLDRERLPESRNSLDEDMSSSEERDDDTTDEVILTDDRSPNLILYVREYLANMCECWIHSMRQIADRVWKYGFFAKKNLIHKKNTTSSNHQSLPNIKLCLIILRQ